MKKYLEYKESGINWIGKIPAHWDKSRLKFVGDTILGLTYKPEDVAEDADDGILVLRSSNIQRGQLTLDDNVYVTSKIPDKLKLQRGDILVCSRNGSRKLIGKNILIDDRTLGSTFGAFMTVFRSEYSRFFYYFFNSEVFKSQSGLFLTATINQLTVNTLNNFVACFPSDKDEQTIIANYLDQKTSEIDALIVKKKQLIELYKEERMATINQAVTKGLDPNVPMKDSGISWIGDIPKHWEVKRLKFLVNIRYGLGQPPKQKEDGLPIIRATNISKGKIVTKNLILVDPEDVPMERNPILKTDDIIIVRSGAYTADSAIITERWNGSVTGYDIVVSAHSVYPQLLAYCLLSNYMLANQLFLLRLRAAQPHLNAEEIGETFMLVPPSDEQISIANWLSDQISKLDWQVSQIEKEISLLEEYKTALISEVVLGKIDVREEALN